MGVQSKLCLLIHELGFLPPLLALGPSKRGISNVISAHPNPFRGAFDQTPLCTSQKPLSVHLSAPIPSAIQTPFPHLAQEEAGCTPWAGHTQDRAS